jgi:hypothetical protein
VEVIEAAQHRLAMRTHRRRIHLARSRARRTGARPVPLAPVGPHRPANCSHRQKSRPSDRVARSQATPAAHRNRNQRSKSMPYERTVSSARPAACRCPK